MYSIPVFIIKDKQAFNLDMRFLGKPIDMCKKFKEQGYKLVHIIDKDAKSGSSTNFDIYNNLTFFLNIQVEISSNEEFVKKLLKINSRVVIPPNPQFNLSKESKKLLVAKFRADVDYDQLDISCFNDVILENADDASVDCYLAQEKRIMVFESDFKKLSKEKAKKIWGILLVSF